MDIYAIILFAPSLQLEVRLSCIQDHFGNDMKLVSDAFLFQFYQKSFRVWSGRHEEGGKKKATHRNKWDNLLNYFLNILSVAFQFIWNDVGYRVDKSAAHERLLDDVLCTIHRLFFLVIIQCSQDEGCSQVVPTSRYDPCSWSKWSVVRGIDTYFWEVGWVARAVCGTWVWGEIIWGPPDSWDNVV